MKKIILLIYITYSFAVGLGGASLQVDAISLANYGTGIAGNSNVSINPASIMHDSPNRLSFSYNRWFNDVKGNMIMHEWKNQYILLNSYELNDIDLWGENPDSDPLGTFGTHFVALTYGRGFLINHVKLGFNSRAIHSRLYTESTMALLFDIGFQYNITSYLNIGSVIKNIGFIDSKLDKNEIPTLYGLGISYSLHKLNSKLMLDYSSDELAGTSTKCSFNTKLGFIKLIFAISSIGYKTSHIEEKIFLSGGFEFKYRRWSFTYGILQQDNESLGIPQAFQISWYY